MDVRIVHRRARKPRKMGENLDVNDKPLSGSHVTLTHDLNGQNKSAKLCKKIDGFFQTAVVGKSLES